jgi:catechol 2,3-dioxygenase-like lactoylglutathione lyase family enzyme
LEIEQQNPGGCEIMMKPRITVVTLGVEDLEKALVFYRDGLDLPTEGIVGKEFEHGAVAFFDLQPGLRLALWARRDIAHDAGISQMGPSPTEFTLGHNVSSRHEVDSIMEQARNAGAKITKAAGETFWGGYAGYFQDPDDHLWEVVWNPQLEIVE